MKKKLILILSLLILASFFVMPVNNSNAAGDPIWNPPIIIDSTPSKNKMKKFTGSVADAAGNKTQKYLQYGDYKSPNGVLPFLPSTETFANYDTKLGCFNNFSHSSGAYVGITDEAERASLSGKFNTGNSAIVRGDNHDRYADGGFSADSEFFYNSSDWGGWANRVSNPSTDLTGVWVTVDDLASAPNKSTNFSASPMIGYNGWSSLNYYNQFWGQTAAHRCNGTDYTAFYANKIGGGETMFIRNDFQLTQAQINNITTVRLEANIDDFARVLVNGNVVYDRGDGQGTWGNPNGSSDSSDIVIPTSYFQSGYNVIAFQVTNKAIWRYDKLWDSAIGLYYKMYIHGNSPTLTVTKSGTGAGTVTSDAAGINCGSDCSNNYALSQGQGKTITLTAAPSGTATFGGWTGCDSTSGRTCTVVVDDDMTVNARFNTATAPTCSLTANPTSIERGSSSTLTYQTTNATTASINQSVGTLTPVGSGTKSVSPTSTIIYTLTARNAAGDECTDTATITVTVPTNPTFSCVLNPSGGMSPLDVTATAEVVNMGAGASAFTGPLKFSYDFNYGKTPTMIYDDYPANPADAKVRRITNSYPDEGSYGVYYKITDSAGKVSNNGWARCGISNVNVKDDSVGNGHEVAP